MEPDPVFPGPPASQRPPAHPRYRGPDPRRTVAVAMIGVLVAALLGAFVNARLGALAVAGTLAVAGAWRALAPRSTHAAGIAVRSKTLDVLLYFGMAAAIAFLALTVPDLG